MVQCGHLLLLLLLLLSPLTTLGDKPTQDIIDTPNERARNNDEQGESENNQSNNNNNNKLTSKSTPIEYFNPPFDPNVPPLYSKSGTRLVTLNELYAHGSINGTLRPYWLAIMGRVYDVDKGHAHYGPEGGYSFFTGCDGTKAFVTGEFNDEGLSDDVSELTPLQLLDIEGWVKFYDKDYTYVGKLIGRYYNEKGNPTKHYYKYQKALSKGHEMKAEKESQEREFPPCNSRFTPNEGGIVYCSTKSGGIERDWEGLPRRYFIPGSKDWRCACVHDKHLNSPQVKLYPGCDKDAKQCSVNKNKLHEEL